MRSLNRGDKSGTSQLFRFTKHLHLMAEYFDDIASERSIAEIPETIAAEKEKNLTIFLGITFYLEEIFHGRWILSQKMS